MRSVRVLRTMISAASNGKVSIRAPFLGIEDEHPAELVRHIQPCGACRDKLHNLRSGPFQITVGRVEAIHAAQLAAHV